MENSCSHIAKKCKILMEEKEYVTIDICSLCLEPNAQARLAPCGHEFHTACFFRNGYQDHSPSCPLCRSIVTDVKKPDSVLLLADDDWAPIDQSVSLNPSQYMDSVFPAAPVPNPLFHPSPLAMLPIADMYTYHPMTAAASSNSVLIAPRLYQSVGIEATRAHPCKCTGKCRNGRCSCVREGSVCGVSCRCTECRNPLLPIARMGVSIVGLEKDVCLMQNLSKIISMSQKLREYYALECCGLSVQLYECLRGYSCSSCHKQYEYSWCSSRLLTRRRNHCAKCKRCVEPESIHCEKCGKCYFCPMRHEIKCTG